MFYHCPCSHSLSTYFDFHILKLNWSLLLEFILLDYLFLISIYEYVDLFLINNEIWICGMIANETTIKFWFDKMGD